MQTRTTRGFTTAELLVVIAVALVLFSVFGDAVSNAKYNARASSCKANFMVIGPAMQTYQNSHSGKMPPTLKALLPIIGSKDVFVCVLSPSKQTFPFSRDAYDYRFLSKPNAKDIICWDSHPHLPQHTIFVWLNRPNRNVLYADGQVKNLPEADFQ